MRASKATQRVISLAAITTGGALWWKSTGKGRCGVFAVWKLCDTHLSASAVSSLLWGAIQMSVFTVYLFNIRRTCTGWRKKRGNRPSYIIANIPKTPWPNCMEIGGLLQYYMLNTVINFLFKNFIALWRHLAKTPLLSFIHTVQIDLSITQ